MDNKRSTAAWALRTMGQSLWLDNITRDMLNDGALRDMIDDLAVSGLTSNPSIFDKAIRESKAYDHDVSAAVGQSPDELVFKLAIADLQRAADLFLPVHKRTNGIDGWVSLEVAPMLANDATGTVMQAQQLRKQLNRPNAFIKIPGTTEGLKAIEEAIFAGVPVNVTLLFSAAQYLASVDAYLRGIERRIVEGLDPDVPSVASVFISRWDKAVHERVPKALRNRLGIAVATQTYAAYRELLCSGRMLRVLNAGARPQRLLWGSTGTKDPDAPDTLYVEALAAPFTINTVPEGTLRAFADHGTPGAGLSHDVRETAPVLDQIDALGINVKSLAVQLQREGAAEFVKAWRALVERITEQASRRDGM